MNTFVLFIISLILSIVFTILTRSTAKKINTVDIPDKSRKKHQAATPLLGGFGIFLAFFIALLTIKNDLIAGNLDLSHWIGFFIGAGFLMLGGFLDDKFNLQPKHQFIFPVLASLSVVLGGVSIEKITNPFGGFIFFDAINIAGFSVFSSLIILIWLLGMMYTTKLLDGVDGLVSGVTAIGAIIIFLFTMTTKYFQPDIGLASLALAGSCLGFLIFNWYPASIFLGEGGSLFLGFALGVLAIISGGKIAIALLVMGIPIMDVAWIILRRIKEGKNPFKFADRKHLHFRLQDIGFSPRQTVLIYYGLSSIFGLSALFLQSIGKIFVLVFLVILMFIIIFSFSYLEKKNAAISKKSNSGSE